MSFLCFARSLDIELCFVHIGWIRSVVAVLMMRPISFAGLGLREGSLVLLLPPYGVAESDAVALSLLLFANNVAIKLLGGLVELRYALQHRTAHPTGHARPQQSADKRSGTGR